MRPLMQMFWATNKRLLLLMSPILGFYLSLMVYTQFTHNGIDIPAMVFVTMFLLLIVSTFQGLTFEVEGFLASLPVTRAQLVRTKYVTSCLGLLAGLVLPLTVAWTVHALLPGRAAAPTPADLRYAAMLAIFDAMGLFLFMPFVHRFEPSKGILAFSVAVVLALAGGLAWQGLDGVEALFQFFQCALAEFPPTLGILTGLLALGLLSLSLSTWCYGRRSF